MENGVHLTINYWPPRLAGPSASYSSRTKSLTKAAVITRTGVLIAVFCCCCCFYFCQEITITDCDDDVQQSRALPSCCARFLHLSCSVELSTPALFRLESWKASVPNFEHLWLIYFCHVLQRYHCLPWRIYSYFRCDSTNRTWTP